MRKLLIVICLVVVQTYAMADEQPRYTVLRSDQGFELRRYEPYLVAETVVDGDFEDVGSQAFRILADYIGGKNEGRQEIAMTAPVNQAPVTQPGEKIEMTAPVVQAPRQGATGTYVFSFVMPSRYTLETLPRPTDPRVTLRRVEGRLMAARTYSGTWSEERYRENETALLRDVQAAGLQPNGAPVFARYNAPFTPWFMRRNEVIVQVREEPAIQPGD